MYSPCRSSRQTINWILANLQYWLKAHGFKVYNISFRVQTKKNKTYLTLCDFKKIFKLHISQPPKLNLCQPCSDSQEKGVISETQPDAKPCGYHHSLSWLSFLFDSKQDISTCLQQVILKRECPNDSLRGKGTPVPLWFDFFLKHILLTETMLYQAILKSALSIQS